VVEAGFSTSKALSLVEFKDDFDFVLSQALDHFSGKNEISQRWISRRLVIYDVKFSICRFASVFELNFEVVVHEIIKI
jgi:hypothetical protein